MIPSTSMGLIGESGRLCMWEAVSMGGCECGRCECGRLDREAVSMGGCECGRV